MKIGYFLENYLKLFRHQVPAGTHDLRLNGWINIAADAAAAWERWCSVTLLSDVAEPGLLWQLQTHIAQHQPLLGLCLHYIHAQPKKRGFFYGEQYFWME